MSDYVLDWLTLDEMVATGEGPDEAWEALLCDPLAHERWEQAMERRRWLETIATLAARSTHAAVMLGEASRATGRSQLDGPAPPGVSASAPRDVLSAIGAAALSVADAARAAASATAFSGGADKAPVAPRSFGPEAQTATLVPEWGAVRHFDVGVGCELKLEHGEGVSAWAIYSGGTRTWPKKGWRVDRADGVVAIVFTSPAAVDGDDLDAALAVAERTATVMIHPIDEKGENETG